MSITETQPQTAGWTADDSSFGARLALIRQKMGWGNIAKAAKECGVPTDSWRNWEVDGREPHRLVTIALAIATRTGCDLDWLVYGPDRKGVRTPTSTRGRGAHVVATMPAFATTGNGVADQLADSHRPVRQTRPIIGGRPQPLSLSSSY